MTTETAETAQIAAFAASIRFEALPSEVVHEAKRALLNITGCMLGGIAHPMLTVLDHALSPFAGPSLATIIGRPDRRDVLQAASLNGASSSVYAFDDSYERTILHPTGPAAAAGLALAEWRGSAGKDLLAAFVAGIETTCRVSRALAAAPAQSRIGWSQTGIAGVIGATVTSARLLGLDAEATARAIGIAANLACGTRSGHGSMTTPFLTAHGAETGIRCALLAQGGLSAPATALEHRYGLLALFAERPDSAALTRGLGQEFELHLNSYKPYPCGVVLQAAVEACLAIGAKMGGRAIASLAIEAAPETAALCDRPAPRDHLEAQVSLQHWCAVALLRRSAGLAEGGDESVRDFRIAALRGRVSLLADPALLVHSARATAVFTDGTTSRHDVEHCIGSARRPMSDALIERKFAGQAADVLPPAKVAAAIEQCWQLHEAPGLDGFLESLRPA